MNKAFEKIVEMLEELRETYDEMAFIEMNTNGHTLDFEYAKGKKDVMLEVRKIVQEVAEEYNNDWVPCGERMPEEHKLYDITFRNDAGIHSDSAIYNPFLKRWLWDSDET